MKVSIGQAAKVLGVSIPTLRRWEKEGKIKPERTPHVVIAGKIMRSCKR